MKVSGIICSSSRGPHHSGKAVLLRLSGFHPENGQRSDRSVFIELKVSLAGVATDLILFSVKALQES